MIDLFVSDQIRECVELKDRTLTQVVSLICLTVLCVAALWIDGSTGETIAMAGSAALGAAAGYAFQKTKKEGETS